MNIFNRNNNNFSITEIEKAEILEAYTRKLNDGKLSRFQKKLLKSGRYDKELTPLRSLIKQTHETKKEVPRDIAVPRPGAKRRVKTNILDLISGKQDESRGSILPFNLSMEPAPVSPEPVGYDTPLEEPVYGEPEDRRKLNEYVLKFKIVDGDEKGRECAVSLSELDDSKSQAAPGSQRFTTIGRGSSAEVQVEDSSNKMSRLHAKLYMQNNSAYIEDLDSTNGIYVNGVRITDKSKLSTDSTVKMGGVTVQILSIDESETE